MSILDFDGISKAFRRVLPNIVIEDGNRSHRSNCSIGRKKFNLCSKCELRHAAPTGKGCTAGVGVQQEDQKDNGDGFIEGETGPQMCWFECP